MGKERTKDGVVVKDVVVRREGDLTVDMGGEIEVEVVEGG